MLKIKNEIDINLIFYLSMIVFDWFSNYKILKI